jgi:peptidyl-prolyl cis-trans isomerase SDCCAG10
VLNPFDDIIPRISERERQHTKMLEEQKKKKQEEEMKKRNKKSGKK